MEEVNEMTLTEKQIKKNATGAAFKKGKNLYFEGGVVECIIDRDQEKRILYLNGKVKGNEVPMYEVSMDFDEGRDYEVIESRCQCQAYRTYPGHCKHMVALQLAFLEQDEKEQKSTGKENQYPVVTEFIEFLEDVEKIKERQRSSGKKQETREEQLRRLLGMDTVQKGMKVPKPQTDRTIKKILDRLTTQYKEAAYQEQGTREPVELEPQLSLENTYNGNRVSFKIGGKKKYVVKSLETLVESIESREYVSYGKNLAFVHTREQFSASSLPLLDFITEYVHMRDRSRSFYNRPVTKEILLQDMLFEKFILAIEEGRKKQGQNEMFLSIPGEKGTFYYVRRENPDFLVTLEKDQNGAFLRFPVFQIILGSTEIFLIDGNTIYHCNRDFERDMRILLEQFRIGDNRELFIEDEDLQSVCASIMPLLERYFTVEEKDISVEKYQPPEVEFLVYLDDEKDIGVTCRVECKYGETKYRIFEEVDTGVYRDVQKETQMIQILRKYFLVSRRRTSDFMLNEEEKLYMLLLEGIDEINQMGQVFATEAFRRNGISQTPGVDIGVSMKSDLLDLSVSSKQLPYEELDEILNSYKLRKRYHRLKNGKFLELESSSLSVLSELADGLQISGKDLRRGMVQIPKHRALYVDAVLKDAGDQLRVHRDSLFKGLIRNIKNVDDSDYEIPEQQYDILRGYQKKGYRWLRTIREYGFGGILADDMGLGKTLQVITLFQAVKEERQQKGKTDSGALGLVVCPASLVYNWESEIQKFAPDLSVQVVSGTASDRKSLLLGKNPKDVWITSYDLLKRDVEWYQRLHFDVHVIDEAQYIKNANTKAAKAVKMISSNTRFALTGTPIENRLSELWSIFDFLMPGLLFSYKQFKEEMESSILAESNGEEQQDGKALKRLKNMVRPFILRRLKKDVLKDLPKKLEHVMYAKMEGEQEKLYQARVQRLRMQIEGQTNEEYNKNKIEILSELTRLRQICCDPALCYEDYKGGSAKLSMCMELVEDAVGSGHKLLLFSQFTTMLDTLADELKKRKISFYMLTGETKKEKRIEMANAFNENQVPVFLISLRAGGTGLNLTGADMVIHFDPWWNLAAQNQATDRAHRIGQKNVVTVFKMITAKTIEEKILALQEKKRDLADQIISDEGMSEGSFTREELLAVLRA